MSQSGLFKWRHYQPDIILCCLRWYLPLSYRQVEELITERGCQWTTVQWCFAGYKHMLQLDKRCRRYCAPHQRLLRVDEPTSKSKGSGDIFTAVDSAGNTLDFCSLLSGMPRGKTVFCKTLKAAHNQQPRVVTVDKNAAYLKQ